MNGKTGQFTDLSKSTRRTRTTRGTAIAP